MATQKPTVARLKQMVDELLTIQAVAERYAALEKQIKADMDTLKWKEVVVPGKGRVEISKSERATISPESVRSLLPDLANQIIQIKESVPNKLVEAFLQGRLITREQYKALDEQAQRTPVISLYVRPLK
jgi:hypothetical protein